MKQTISTIILACMFVAPIAHAQAYGPSSSLWARQILINRYFATAYCLYPGNGCAAGSPIMQHLQELFTLNSLFNAQSNGLLTPGPATIENLIVLYELFFANGVSR